MASGRPQARSPRPSRTSDTSPVVKLEIYDVEKVRGVSNYYLYIIQVTCKDGTSYSVRRRYRQFDEMQNSLEKRFPIEAGAIRSKDRTLPTLPGKVIFGRSAVKNVTDRRLPLLNEYLEKLVALPDKIRYDSIVQGFTRPSADDMLVSTTPSNGLSKPVKPDRSVPPLKPLPPAGRPNPKPLRPTQPGPAKKAPPPRPVAPGSKVKTGPRAKALYSYSGQYADELSFNEGAVISLIRRADTDWWEGQVDGRKGLVPSNYIDVIEHPVQRNLKDAIHSSDEWDSSDDEDKGRVTYYFNGAARTVDVELSTVRSPTLAHLLTAIQKHLHRRDIVLNYKDRSGDLVEIVDDNDMPLLKTEAIPPRKQSDSTCHAPWAIYVTLKDDHAPYHRQQTS